MAPRYPASRSWGTVKWIGSLGPPPIRAIRSWPRLTRWLTATRAAAASSMDTQETPGPGTPTDPMGTPRAPSCSISASSMGRVRTSTPSTLRRRGIRAKKPARLASSGSA